jgi:hypothetical protein
MSTTAVQTEMSESEIAREIEWVEKALKDRIEVSKEG